jgi:hypothetical protein
MSKRRTRKRGSGKKTEAEKIWKEFLARRKDAKYREFMKKNPLKKMTVKDAFKQPNLPKSSTTYNVLTDAKIKELEKDLMKKSGTYVEGKTVTKYPKKAGRKRRKTKRRKTKRRKTRRRKTKRKRR